MQDVFIEYMVKRQKTGKTMLIKFGSVAGALIIAIAAMMLSGLLGPLSVLGPLIAAAALYGAYYVITSQNVEFEYAVTNGEIDVDRIIAQRKRARLCSVNCREVEAFGKFNEKVLATPNISKTIMACDSVASSDVWYAIATLKDKGRTLVVFNANDKMINAMKPYLPRPIMHEVFKVGS